MRKDPKAFENHGGTEALSALARLPNLERGLTAIQGSLLGTPTVTLDGPYLRHRLAAGACRTIGAPGLIASDEDDYVDLITNQERLAAAWSTAKPDRLLMDLTSLRALETHIEATLVA